MDHYIVSARKYRPSTFSSVVGQKALTSTLKNAIATGRLAHSYLFCGSRGVGKTSCARIFAKTINCSHPTADGEACNECDSCRAFNDGNSMNIIELDAASNNGVDDMRALVDQVQVPPSQGRYRVFIVDEVHMLSTAAFNAFLKTLEEPPSYVIFILATTEKHKIIPTILSRCQIYDFNRITIPDMVEHLKFVASEEGYTVEPSALTVIARKADGAMRDALSIFDQVAACSRGQITYQSTIENLNVLDHGYYDRLIDCFTRSRVLDSWLIYKEIRDKGFDSHFFIVGLADYMRDLMVSLSPATITLLETDVDTRKAMAATAAKCTPDFIYRAMNLLNEADINWRTASNKQFLVELTLAKICQLLSPSPNNDGTGEGRLLKIEDERRPAVPTQKPAAQPVAQPTAQPLAQPVAQPQPRPIASAPVPPPPAPTVTVRPVIKGAKSRPSFSINGGANRDQADNPAPDKVVTVTEPRSNPFSIEQLNKAWQEYIDANPKMVILGNTMRASYPQPVEGFAYKMLIENEKQREEMANAMPTLMKYLRDMLQNDLFELSVEMNRGESSPHTWNERKVLEHMVSHSPGLAKLIEDFQLTIG